MPYIKSEDREILETIVDAIKTTPLLNAGELNYIFTVIAKTYIKNHGLSYERLNHVTGALDDAKDEFRRRVVDNYERNKREANGDVE